MGVPSPLPEARALLMHVLGLDWAGLVLASGRVPSPAEAEHLEALTLRRLAREPLQHLLGEVEWGGLHLRVSPAALIPRPETETLLNLALEALADRENPLVLDVGTGSGALALGLRAARPDARVTATDISPEALALARCNAVHLGLEVRFMQADLLQDVSGRFHLIVSNPPYLPDADRERAQPEVRHDPDLALYGGADGLRLARRLVAQAPAHLEAGGALLLELDPRNVGVLAAEMTASGWSVQVQPDLTGRERFLRASPLNARKVAAVHWDMTSSTEPRPTTFNPDWEAAFSPGARRLGSNAIREILKITQSPEIISFAGGLPAPELLPIEEVRAAAGTVLDTYGAAALQYSSTEGHLPLREWIAARHGISPANVQIMTGSQQGLDLLGKLLIGEGDVVLVEAPTYLGALQSFGPYGPKYAEMQTDDGGIDIDALEGQLSRLRRAGTPAKLLYCVPNFQNPTGRTLSLERRQRLVELTARFGVVVLEDDPYGALRFTGEAIPSVYELALAHCGGPESSHVIYSGSFSKVLAPGLRDAWVQAAGPMIGKLIQAKQGADLHTPTFNQMIVSELVEIVMPAQIERVRALYGARAQTMLAQMQTHFPAGVTYTAPEGGMFLWVRLPEGIDTAALLLRAVERQVAFVPGAPFFALGGGHNTLRLSFSSATTEQIGRGIQALGLTILEALA